MAKRAQNGAGPSDPPLTPASEFRQVREQGEIIELPTGRVIRMRIVKPGDLLRLGNIPDPLSEMVMRAIYGDLSLEEYRAFFDLPERREQTLDMLESLRVVCTAALVYPRIVEEPQADDEIHISDLSDREQRFIFDLALLEAAALKTFRQRQAEGLEFLAEEPESEVPAEPIAESGG